ncbi:hypothetical protein QLQ12_34610 [Actinoplanes sp. NEAU-A12]|uniref:Transposase n=1 Tax=Actinoplanes sandaracinus TaxID=3045177 RepID=A0ABT6WVN9_9ACTN|nr:hypothetical protein [Actinoplanes sandaracinus]MDI6103759.1 hypothetical protein [Actinoplanes sandaracinus]
MVSDDDTEPRDPNVFPPRPHEFRDPADDKIETLIVQLARQEPDWGRRWILEALRRRGFTLDQAHVDHVLRKYGLPNLDL